MPTAAETREALLDLFVGAIRGRDGEPERYEAPRMPAGYSEHPAAQQHGGTWIEARALANFYAQLFNDLQSAGAPPDEQTVDDANDSLNEHGWAVEQNEDDVWEANDLSEERHQEGPMRHKRVAKGTPGAVPLPFKSGPTVGKSEEEGGYYYVLTKDGSDPRQTSAKRKKAYAEDEKVKGAPSHAGIKEQIAKLKGENEAEGEDIGNVEKELSPSGHKKAMNTLNAMKRFYGEHTLHRLEEMTGWAHKALKALKGLPASDAYRQMVTRRLLNDLTRIHAMTEAMEGKAGEKPDLSGSAKIAPAPEAAKTPAKPPEAAPIAAKTSGAGQVAKPGAVDYGDLSAFTKNLPDPHKADVLAKLQAATKQPDARVKADLDAITAKFKAGKTGSLEETQAAVSLKHGLDQILWKRGKAGASVEEEAPAEAPAPEAPPPPAKAKTPEPPAKKPAPAPAEAKKANPHAEKAIAEMQASIDGSAHLSPEQKAYYGKSVREVVGRMTPKMLERFTANVKGAPHFAANPEAVKAYLVSVAEKVGKPEVVEKMKKATNTGGAYIRRGASGSFVLDGDRPTKTGKFVEDSAASVYAHEFAHAIDGARKELSTSPAWQEAFRGELQKGKLTKYAGTDPTEGFAEFGRLILGGKFAHADIEKAFPASFAYWKSQGLLDGAPEQKTAPGGGKPVVPELFSSKIDLGEMGHADEKLAVPVPAPAATPAAPAAKTAPTPPATVPPPAKKQPVPAPQTPAAQATGGPGKPEGLAVRKVRAGTADPAFVSLADWRTGHDYTAQTPEKQARIDKSHKAAVQGAVNAAAMDPSKPKPFGAKDYTDIKPAGQGKPANPDEADAFVDKALGEVGAEGGEEPPELAPEPPNRKSATLASLYGLLGRDKKQPPPQTTAEAEKRLTALNLPAHSEDEIRQLAKGLGLPGAGSMPRARLEADIRQKVIAAASLREHVLGPGEEVADKAKGLHDLREQVPPGKKLPPDVKSPRKPRVKKAGPAPAAASEAGETKVAGPAVRLDDPKALAAAVHEAGRAIPAAVGGHTNTGDLHHSQSHKPFLVDVYDALKDRLGGATLEQFKQAILQAHLAGEVELGRLDMVQAARDRQGNKGTPEAYNLIKQSEVPHFHGAYHTVNTNSEQARRNATPAETATTPAGHAPEQTPADEVNAEIADRTRTKEETPEGQPLPTGVNASPGTMGEKLEQTTPPGLEPATEDNVPYQRRARIRNAIEKIKDFNEELQRMKDLEKKVGGHGRYQSELREKRRKELDEAKKTIEDTRRTAESKGIDLQPLLDKLGHAPETPAGPEEEGWGPAELKPPESTPAGGKGLTPPVSSRLPPTMWKNCARWTSFACWTRPRQNIEFAWPITLRRIGPIWPTKSSPFSTNWTTRPGSKPARRRRPPSATTNCTSRFGKCTATPSSKIRGMKARNSATRSAPLKGRWKNTSPPPCRGRRRKSTRKRRRANPRPAGLPRAKNTPILKQAPMAEGKTRTPLSRPCKSSTGETLRVHGNGLARKRPPLAGRD